MIAAAALQAIPFFQDLDPAELAAIANLAHERAFQRGQLIFLEGDANVGLWFVARGQMKIFRAAPEGKEQILCVTGPGACFGGCPLFDSDFYPATAQAATDGTLYIVPRPDAQDMAHQSPAVAQALLRVFAGRLRSLSRMAEGLTFRCVTGRLAGTLLAWADEQRVTGEQDTPVQVPLTQDDLAALLGTSPSVIRRAFLRLERLGTMEARGRQVTIRNCDLLRQLVLNV